MATSPIELTDLQLSIVRDLDNTALQKTESCNLDLGKFEQLIEEKLKTVDSEAELVGQVQEAINLEPTLICKLPKVVLCMFSQAAGSGYLTADLMASGVMETMDIMDIRHPDSSFDAIYCSHVLEHVDDDRKAVCKFYRVLKPAGWAILNVPITAAVTFEDPTIIDPAERLRLFRRYHHVRRL